MTIPENYRALSARLAAAAQKSGRASEEILFLAVTKSVDLPQVKALYELGLRNFAENREPELLRKSAALPADIVWHFIGPLQSNKVRKVVKCAQVIHALDTLAVIERVDRICGEEKRRPDVMIEVNVSGEASKGGFTVDEAREAARLAASCRNFNFKGLMTMAPNHADEAMLKNVFCGLAALRDELEKSLQITLPYLSMGMSGDFETAIACGSTIVRIGTALYE